MPETDQIVASAIELLLKQFNLQIMQANFTKQIPKYATLCGMATTLSNVNA
jgi:hypothetical protein